MLDKKVSDLLNAQVNKEFYSAYLYMNGPDGRTFAVGRLCAQALAGGGSRLRTAANGGPDMIRRRMI